MWVQSLVGRPPRYEHGNPLQYSCLENPMDRDAWQAAVHGVAESGLTEATQHARILTIVLWWGHSTWPGYFSYKYHWIFFFLALCISPVPTHFQPGHIDFAGSSYSSNNVAFLLKIESVYYWQSGKVLIDAQVNSFKNVSSISKFSLMSVQYFHNQ